MPIRPGRSRKDKDDLLAALLTIADTQIPGSSSVKDREASVRLWQELRDLLAKEDP